ncbi:hypothetical protein SAMN05660464_3695 [Geodermatophilus dictyosporus]|uniref:Uncharacterized protein n=1 Tax=Geodermatophilus dictyosporus TaxID=1523247 RepID=A0A1I5RSH9_9ACTN|nr:hypothetical protein [Geodermatophilus dictyosporus]SFP61484.1 hypothetical protein SAMN05660464_3695 [Geodermatophilus dictyosporus]
MPVNVLTQPYGRPEQKLSAQDNFLVTLHQPFDLAGAVQQQAAGQVSLTNFLRAHPTGAAHIWALSNNHIGQRVWPAIQPDDLVLFYGNGQVYAYGFVTSKVHWPGNSFIWPSGADWDYIYSLRDFQLVPKADARGPAFYEVFYLTLRHPGLSFMT